MARTEENLAFSERLKQALSRHPRKIETATKLGLEFNLVHHESVTNQAAQKWMTGLAKPSPDKIETLARMCNVSAQWLRFGIPEIRQEAGQSQAVPGSVIAPTSDELDLLGRYRLLSEHQQGLITELIEQLAMEREMWVSPD